MNAASLKARFLLLGFLLAVLAKFWLVWELEIADATNDPHEYVLQILYPANGGLGYPPGTGLAGQFFHNFGIPFRLGIDAAFLIAVTLLIRALVAWPWKKGWALGLFVLLVFDPSVARCFAQFYSDNVWLVETLLGFSAFVLGIETGPKPKWGWIATAVILLGLSSITRSIVVPLMLGLIAFTLLLLLLILSKYRAPSLKSRLDLLALSLPSLIFGISLIYGNTAVYDFAHHGYTGISYLDSAQYKKFYLTLQSVGEPDGDPYFPIDENRRQLIAQAGPDSKWFIQQVESNGVYKQAGLDHYGKYDIPAGWFHWAAFTAAMDPAKGNYLDAYSLFHNIEDEIAAANDMGIIKVRHVASLPDSRIPIVLSVLPQSVLKTIRSTLYEFKANGASYDAGLHGLYTNPEFTAALNRRAVEKHTTQNECWIFLSKLYLWFYTQLTTAAFLVSFVCFAVTLISKWKSLPEFPLDLIAPLFFTNFFFIFFAWYALFDASGMPALTRYMIFNHLLLYPLIYAYITGIIRLSRKTSSQRDD